MEKQIGMGGMVINESQNIVNAIFILRIIWVKKKDMEFLLD